jgi:hypothetical protein
VKKRIVILEELEEYLSGHIGKICGDNGLKSHLLIIVWRFPILISDTRNISILLLVCAKLDIVL